MSIVANLIDALFLVFSWPTIGFVILGLFLGIFFGALPGIGASLGLALVLPFTIPLGGLDAIILLVSVYSGAMYGGSIAAILINAPGTGGSAATTFDGYPMSRQGKAQTALAISATASAVGGFITIVALLFMIPVLVEVVLAFGSPEYFLIAVFGIAMITLVSKGSMAKGIVAGAFGLFLTSVGSSPTVPVQRYTFDQLSLFDGISYVAALIGVFAVGEMIKLVGERGMIAKEGSSSSGGVLEGVKFVFKNPYYTVKSSAIGMGLGMVPGAGASVSNFIAYGEMVRSVKEKFGYGNPYGVLASEASNNGTVAGSLVPTLSFGIPGSGSAAVLLGGILMHGLRPGPQLFTEELYITYGLLVALIIGNVLILLLGVSLLTRSDVITRIDTDIIIPIVIVLSFMGALTLRNNWVDVMTVLLLGMLGYVMVKHNYSIIGFVLGVVLGGIAEENFNRSLQLSGDSIPIFFTNPLSILLIMLIVATLLVPYADEIKQTLAKVK